MSKTGTLSEILKDIYEDRKTRNRKYSMRAFARDLGISPGRLSEMLTGQNIPGPRLTQRLVTALKMTPEQSQGLVGVVQNQKKTKRETGGALQLKTDEFAVIANREHFSLLCLMETSNFKSDIDWMSKRLGISKAAVSEALDRLERLGLVKQSRGIYKSTHKDLTTSHDIPSEAIQQYHRQGLNHATQSLLEDPPDFRDITSIEMPADIRKLKEVKNHIRDFRRKMAKLLEDGEQTEVYRLNIQLVPVTSRGVAP